MPFTMPDRDSPQTPQGARRNSYGMRGTGDAFQTPHGRQRPGTPPRPREPESFYQKSSRKGTLFQTTGDKEAPHPAPAPRTSRPVWPERYRSRGGSLLDLPWNRIGPVCALLGVLAVLVAGIWLNRVAITMFIQMLFDWVLQILVLLILVVIIIRIIMRLLFGR